MASDIMEAQNMADRIDALTQANEKLVQTLNELLKVASQSNQAIGISASSTSIPSAQVPVPRQPLKHSRNDLATALDNANTNPLFSEEESSRSEEDESFFVQDVLKPEPLTEQDLRNHLRHYAWKSHSRLLLGDLIKKGHLLDDSDIFLTDSSSEQNNAANQDMRIYDIGSDGALLPSFVGSGPLSEEGWQRLINTNSDETTSRKTVGRIVIAREPGPLLSGAIHLAMNEHFDMDEIFRILTDGTHTKAYMKGCSQDDPRQQRSFLFSFKYHCIVDENRQPIPWQRSDDDDEELEPGTDLIPISRCSSIVALSLAGDQVTLRKKSRRKRRITAKISDPFAPWRVLCIQAFPDERSTTETRTHYVNGPEGFLMAVLAEYKDAFSRLAEINRRIVALVTPPSLFMSSTDLLHDPMFQDRGFTYLSRSFWAFHTLSTMNENIRTMLSAYHKTFTEDVWIGEHKYIWPGNKDQSARYRNWRKKMAGLRKQFETVLRELDELSELNNKEQRKIEALRGQLYSVISVLETREAIRQQDYIKLLTLATIFFLPLTFVTSIFGMTNMPSNANFVLFGCVTVAICTPTYLVVGTLSSEQWLKRYRILWRASYIKLRLILGSLVRWLHSKFNRSQRHLEETRESKDIPPRPKEGPKSQPLSINSNANNHKKHDDPDSGSQELDDLSAPQPAAYESTRKNTVKFDLPTFDMHQALAQHESGKMPGIEEGVPDEDSGFALPEEDQSPGRARSGLLRSFHDKAIAQSSPRSPV